MKRITRNSKAAEPGDINSLCGKCDKEVDGDIVQCEICDIWFHINCQDVSQEKFNALKMFDDIHWYCKSCGNATSKILKTVTALEKEVSGVKEDMKKCTKDVSTLDTRLRTGVEADVKVIKKKYVSIEKLETSLETAREESLSDMDAKLTTFKEKMKEELENKVNTAVAAAEPDDDKLENALSELKNQMIEIMNNRIAEIPGQAAAADVGNDQNWQEVERRRKSAMQREVNEAMVEKDKINERKNNLIIQNLSESGSTNEDLGKVRNLIRNKLNITEEIAITDITRMGTEAQGKTRWLKIILQQLKHKKLILSKATTLRNLDEDDEFSKVYIKPDLTPKQVEASKNLYAELKAIREREPTKKWKIYRGEIVQINETGELVI